MKMDRYRGSCHLKKVYMVKKKEHMLFVENGGMFKEENKINPNLTTY